MTKVLKNKNLFLSPSSLISNNTSKEFNDSSYKTSKNKLRPKLALKKSFSFNNNITNPNNNKTKIIQIINSINITQYNKYIHTEANNNIGLFNKNKIIDNESIKVKNRQINKEIKKIRKILIDVNEQNKKKDEEINKQGNLIDKILNINKQAYIDILENLEKNFKKDKNKNFNDLLNKLYMQYHELIKENNEQDSEIKNLKKNIKNTKRNELIIENNILINQYNKYKYLCTNLEKSNAHYQNKIKKKQEIENAILDKNFEILQLQENLKLSNTINIQKEQEKSFLIKKIKEYQTKNKEIKNKISQLNEEYNFILLTKKNLEDNLYTIYNTNNANILNNEISYNKNVDTLSSNINSNNVSNIINQSNINNISNTLEESVNAKEENKIKILDEENNLNTVDEEKITNMESETNFKKDFIDIEKNKISNEMINSENKNRLKYNESFFEKNSDLTE